MSAKRNIKMATDLTMTMPFPVLMAYSLVRESVCLLLGICVDEPESWPPLEYGSWNGPESYAY